jgi:uncharacterized protein YktB (UPF0637 family)
VFNGFKENDFDVFAVEGLDNRMEALKNRIRPKLEEIGVHFKEVLSEQTGEEMYFHVAKHARRKVNPPEDTWVAFSNNNRGYKKLPHFQIGLFGSHLFVWFAVIYESPVKKELGREFQLSLNDVHSQIPSSFEWSVDHTKPQTTSHEKLSKEGLNKMFSRLETVKKAELLCGITIDYGEPILKDGDALIEKIENTFSQLMPLYRASMNLYEQKV